jgi:hypothetical protein
VTRRDVRRAAQIGVSGRGDGPGNWSCGFAGPPHVLGKECWRASRLAVAPRLGPEHLKLKRAKSQIKF